MININHTLEIANKTLFTHEIDFYHTENGLYNVIIYKSYLFSPKFPLNLLVII